MLLLEGEARRFFENFSLLLIGNYERNFQLRTITPSHRRDFLSAISKGPKHSLRLFIVIRPILAWYKTKATARTVCAIAIAIAFRIANQWTRRRRKRALTKRGAGEIRSKSSAPLSLLKPFRMRPLYLNLSMDSLWQSWCKLRHLKE